ncbi:hypothetical protein RS81_00163 [Microbacterium terrae]|uniref:Uncharacterized protein n=1 Tax=Microbacterium terrae TaxID=69369 RepID=A0A0M2HM85_9MICO|nr:hypothetical protein RS81_00163 [Microbacterium terrae]
MSRRGELAAAVRRHRDGERAIERANPQRSAAHPHRGFEDVDARAALLRSHVRHGELVGGERPPAEPGPRAQVGVARHRAEPDDVHALRRTGQLEVESEARPVGGPPGIRHEVGVESHRAVGQRRPHEVGVDGGVADRRPGAGAHPHRGIRRLDPDQAGDHAVDAGLVPAHRHRREVGLVVAEVAVVVGRRAPHPDHRSAELEAAEARHASSDRVEGHRPDAVDRRGLDSLGSGDGDGCAHRLPVRDDVSGRRPGRRGCGRRRHGDDVGHGRHGRARLARRRRQRDRDRRSGRARRNLELAGIRHHAVDHALPRQHEVRQVEEVVAVLDHHRRAVVGDAQHHRRDHGRVVQQPRARHPVGRHQAVDDEVAVVHVLAEVSAVQEPAPAGAVVGGEDAVLQPFPDEPARDARVPLEQVPVLVEPAGTGAHRVGELALQERQREPVHLIGRAVERRGVQRLLADLAHLVERRVHARVHVDVATGPVALVVHESRGVEGLRPRRHRLEVLAVVRLVAERPHDHARVVLVTVHGAAHAVEVGALPARVGARVAAPAGVLESMALEVALVDDPEAEFVEQIEHLGMRRIVRGAHRVDVVPLHEKELVSHDARIEDATVLGVMLVTVDAPQHDRSAVDQQHGVAGLDAAEADAHRGGLGRGDHARLVQTRRLGGPRLDDAHADAGTRRRVDGELVDHDARRRAAVGRDGGIEHSLRGGGVVVGHEEHVVDPAGRAAEEGDAAEDAGQPPHVLVLEIGGIAELRHAHREAVGPGDERARHIELVGEAAAACGAEQGVVQPDLGRRLDAVEAEDAASVGEYGSRCGELEPVVADGTRVRRERRVYRERHLHIRVRRSAVALQIPVARDDDRAPAGRVGGAPVSGCAAQRRRDAERPPSVERLCGRIRAQTRAGREGAGAGKSGGDVHGSSVKRGCRVTARSCQQAGVPKGRRAVDGKAVS